MDKLTIEEKAKRYEEAIERANELNYVSDKDSLQRKIVEHIFPQLKESEDERIRKEIIDFIYDKTDTYELREKSNSWLAWLEKQGEQKPTDKIEPKFHEGDWAVSKLDRKARRISEVHHDEYNDYYVVEGNEYDIEEYDRRHHLWTIQDAKDGDVLSSRDGQWIYLYKEKIDDSSFDYHILYSTIHQDLTIDDSGFTLLSDAIIPATKEQRDTLMKAMADKGYTFDFDKKELKKIEQKPTWSYEDRKNYQMLQKIICDSDTSANLANKLSDWLKDLKSRAQPQPRQEWSEEDKRSIRDSIFYLKSAKKYFEKDDDILWDEKWFNLCIEFLEALYKKLQPQPQWKLSDEQIGALEHFVRSIAESGYASPHDNNTKLVYSLFNDLKKLREE